MTDQKFLLEEKLRLVEELARIASTNRRGLFRPNPKQWEFCSSHAREVFLTGPNQWGGKTYTIRYLIATHATGDYPPEWAGPRFDAPPVLLVLSKTVDANRDQIVHHLFSDLFDMESTNGPGWFRPEEYDKSDLDIEKRTVKSAKIPHRGPNGEINGKTVIYFLSYDMGWKRIAGYTANGVFGNECPEMALYTEMKARINATEGRLWIGACPLEEEPDVYFHFLESSDGKTMHLVDYTIDDCTHLTKEQYDDAIRRWGNHPEAEARLYGRPCRAGGVVFPYPYDMISCPPARPAPTDHCIIGLDFPHGTGTFAAVLLAIDRSTDTWRFLSEYGMAGQEAPVNAHRVRLMGGDRIPCAWPKDGNVRASGATSLASETIAEKYKNLGLNMTYDHAFFWNGTNRSSSVMAMVEAMQDRFSTGRLFVSQACPGLLQEIRAVRHKNGEIVKTGRKRYDILDAAFKAMMMEREAKPLSTLGDGGQKRQPARAAVVQRKRDYDFFA